MYNLDILKLVRRLTPQMIRSGEMVAWVVVLLTPFANLWADLVSYYNQIIAYILINISVASLQYNLRLRYPTVNGYQCFVTTVYDKYPASYTNFVGEHHLQEDYDYYENEGQPDTYEYFIEEYDFKYQYFVFVPTNYIADEQAIINFLNTYRPAGRQYLLQFQDL